FPVGDALFLDSFDLSIDRSLDISGFDARANRRTGVEGAGTSFLISESADALYQLFVSHQRLVKTRALTALQCSRKNLQCVKVSRVARQSLKCDVQLRQASQSIIDSGTPFRLLFGFGHIHCRG